MANKIMWVNQLKIIVYLLPFLAYSTSFLECKCGIFFWNGSICSISTSTFILEIHRNSNIHPETKSESDKICHTQIWQSDSLGGYNIRFGCQHHKYVLWLQNRRIFRIRTAETLLLQRWDIIIRAGDVLSQTKFDNINWKPDFCKRWNWKAGQYTELLSTDQKTSLAAHFCVPLDSYSSFLGGLLLRRHSGKFSTISLRLLLYLLCPNGFSTNDAILFPDRNQKNV